MIDKKRQPKSALISALAEKLDRLPQIIATVTVAPGDLDGMPQGILDIPQGGRQTIATGDYAQRIEVAATRLAGVIDTTMPADDPEAQSIARGMLGIYSDLVELVGRVGR